VYIPNMAFSIGYINQHLRGRAPQGSFSYV
jgi:hypothetical protein